MSLNYSQDFQYTHGTWVPVQEQIRALTENVRVTRMSDLHGGLLRLALTADQIRTQNLD